MLEKAKEALLNAQEVLSELTTTNDQIDYAVRLVNKAVTMFDHGVETLEPTPETVEETPVLDEEEATLSDEALEPADEYSTVVSPEDMTTIEPTTDTTPIKFVEQTTGETPLQDLTE